jgi:alpha-L-fucosidase 2
MQRYFLLRFSGRAALLFFLTAGIASYAQDPSTTRMWYDQPASLWTEALPLGNGTIGAMVYGGVLNEVIKLNESSVWAGGPYNSLDDGGAPWLDSIRTLVFNGQGREAEALFNKTMMGRAWVNGSGLEGAPYQPLGNLLITTPGHIEIENYRRELVLDSALVRISYRHKGVTYTRTLFTTAVDQVLAVRLEASRNGQINGVVQLEGVSDPKGLGDGTWSTRTVGTDGISLLGKTRSYPLSKERLEFEGQLLVQAEGGKTEFINQDNNPAIRIVGANSVTIYFAAASNFENYKSLAGNPEQDIRQIFTSIESKTYPEILQSHIADFTGLFNRMSIRLGSPAIEHLPIPGRFSQFAEGRDPNLAALFFQYGRYLLISSSREGGLPANLQGIWNQDIHPAWNSGYTTNINYQMNYWHADLANLSECREPQFSMIRNFAEAGEEAARKNFNAGGWVSYCATDVWVFRSPIYGAYWGSWHTAGAWFCDDIWDHFLYTGDTVFLKKYYPVIRDAALFFDQTLVRHPVHGWWVTNPSGSPENGPGGDKAWKFNPDGSYTQPVGICAGSTIDIALVGELFDHFLEAATLMGTDKDLQKSITGKRKNFPPYQVGRYGQLQEWMEDLDLPEDTHRHISHLWGLYPGTSINPEKDPELAEAVKTTLKQRGDKSTGWSMAWKINVWARLRDGNKALSLLTKQLELTTAQGYRGGGGTYLNLMCAHPPFQVDGNMGAAAGIAEMLMQSHKGYLEFLPALPDAWPDGQIRGLVARGAFEIGMDWENGKWTNLTILSKKGNICRILESERVRVTCDGTPVKTRKDGAGIISFVTRPDKSYKIHKL